MANKQRGEMALNLGPKKYVLRPSFQLLCEIEEALGVGLITFARRLMAGEFGVREIATVFAVAVRDQDGPDTEETGKLIVQDGVAQYVGTLTEFLTTALSGNQKEGPQREGHCHPPPATGRRKNREVIPWRRYMEIGLGVLRLGPDQFWCLTMAEFHAAVDGYIEKSSGTRSVKSARNHQRPTRDRLFELMRRFPDKPRR